MSKNLIGEHAVVYRGERELSSALELKPVHSEGREGTFELVAWERHLESKIME